MSLEEQKNQEEIIEEIQEENKEENEKEIQNPKEIENLENNENDEFDEYEEDDEENEKEVDKDVFDLLNCNLDELGNVIKNEEEDLNSSDIYDQDFDQDEEDNEDEIEDLIEELKTKIILREIEIENIESEITSHNKNIEEIEEKIKEENLTLEKNRKIKEELSSKANLTPKEMNIVQDAIAVIFDKEDLIEELKKKRKEDGKVERRLAEEVTDRKKLIDKYNLDIRGVIQNVQ